MNTKNVGFKLGIAYIRHFVSWSTMSLMQKQQEIASQNKCHSQRTTVLVPYSSNTEFKPLSREWFLLLLLIIIIIPHSSCKGKIHPTTCHEGTGLDVRYSCTLSLTSTLDGGWWLTLCPRHFTPRSAQ